MYYFINGNVDFCEEGRLVVDCNGVGYDICVSNNTLQECGSIGKRVKLYTYLAVSQDDMRLFGFGNKEEKSMFEKLISVSGIGPKMAMQVLSGLNLPNLINAIVCGDVNILSKIKGLGKKTAERIVLELREKLGAIGDMSSSTISIPISTDIVSQEAIMALETFGVARAEAQRLVAEARLQSDKLENIITLALRSMDK